MAALAVPLAESERIASLDALRGFALLGILVMNIWAFSMPLAAYGNPNAYGSLEGPNWWAWFLSHLLFDQKMMTIFSMLFGVGVYVMASRAEARTGKSAAVHYRRMGWMLLFGLLHSYLLWVGDILFMYAVCGLLAYLLRGKSPRTLLITGVLVISVASLLSFFFGWSMQFWPAEEVEKMRNEYFRPPPEKINEEIAAYRGSWVEQVKYRAPVAFMVQTFFTLIWGLWRVGGLMLVGMGLFKLGVFSAERSKGFYWSLIAAGALAGIPLILLGVQQNYAHNWDIRYSFFFGTQWNYWGSLLVSLAWIGAVMLMCKSGALGWLRRAYAAVGRMAFTNYLMQTLICTTIFYGHGLGLFGDVTRFGQVLIVLVVWMVQLLYSPLWLRHFHYGPFEWLWRSLTYRRAQPFRRTAPAPAPAGA